MISMKSSFSYLLLLIWNGVAVSQNLTDCWNNYNTTNSGLASNVVQCVNIGLSDTVWVGAINGLVKYDNTSSWTTYNTSNSGLPNDGVYSVTIDQLGRKWIGTWGGGIAVFEGAANWTIFNTSNSGLPHNFVNVITIDPIGINWIGTLGGGMAIFDGAAWTTYNVSNSGLPGDFIWCISVGLSGNKWIGTSAGLAEYDGTNWTTYNSSNSGIPHPYNIIRSVDFDSQNNKWIGTQGGGLVKFDGVNWTVYNMANSNIPDDDVVHITVDSQDRIWIGTDGGGIAYLEGGTFTVYYSNNSGLPYDQISSILLDQQDNYWISTGGSGLSQMSFQNFSNLPALSLVTSPEEKYFCDSIIILADTGLSNYIWSNGANSPSNTVFASDTYWVYNQDTNGCILARDSISLIHNNFSPYNEEICMVTVDSISQKNTIVLNKTQGKGTDYYKVFKFDNQVGQYDSIGFVYADSAGVFIDSSYNPEEGSQTYTISAVNTCTGESSKSNAHKTMHLTTMPGSSGEICLFWNHYEGFPYTSFDVYMGTAPDSLAYFGSTTDTLFTCLNPPPELTFYQVRIKYPDSCVFSQAAFYTDTRSNITDNDFTAIHQNGNKNQIKIFPNPFNNRLIITNPSPTPYKIIILDLYGRKVAGINRLIKSQEVEVKYLLGGMYILEVFEKGQLIHKETIVKQ
ncbi:MAG TPA: T9SS type A sorting domain-containing protein [Flavobacteriales bacterium]|nr:T9SS type A sorting domain-containing protein [Flavobacteriales bacterium]